MMSKVSFYAVGCGCCELGVTEIIILIIVQGSRPVGSCLLYTSNSLENKKILLKTYVLMECSLILL